MCAPPEAAAWLYNKVYENIDEFIRSYIRTSIRFYFANYGDK